jgi:hypothetical protein
MFSFRSSARVLLVLAASLLFPSVAGAQVATPVSDGTTVFTLVEHPEHVTILDLGDTGKSAGDITVWGARSALR